MFDYGAPKNFPPNSGKPKGVGQHPHRGFETVTIAFQGEVEHGDHLGNKDVIGPGDVQWMTAARGIVHQEFHSKEFSKRGGILEMCQLWVNLPKKHKMDLPKYQPILSSEIKSSPLYAASNGGEGCLACEESDGSVRVIAGNFRGVQGPASTHTQIDMWDVRLDNLEGKEFEFDTVKGNNVIIFVRKGEVDVQGKKLGTADVALLDRDGDKTKLFMKSAMGVASQVLLLAGEPIEEPISAQGPFVMNTREEIMEANMDYRLGRNGF